jgi:TQXA domain-containing protein/LPXTG-motif cell wall-anchored protein
MAADAPAVQNGDQLYIGAQTQGYGGTELQAVYSPTPTDPNNPGTPQFWTYCIEHSGHRNQDVDAVVGDFSSYLGANLFTDPVVQGKVLWVLANSYPALSLQAFGAAAGVPGISQDDAIEATQYAIWRFTDLGFDATWNWADQDSENAYLYLQAGGDASNGLTPAQVAPTVSVTAPSGAQTAGSLVGPFAVHTNQPIAAVTVSPNVAVVDANGIAIDTSAVTDGEQLYLDLSSSTAAGSATVTASVSGSSATGKVLSLPTIAGGTPTVADHAQSLILVTPSTSTTSSQASAQWTAITTGSGSGTNSTTPALAETGFNATALLTIGGVLLALGLVAFVGLRRRRRPARHLS